MIDLLLAIAALTGLLFFSSRGTRLRTVAIGAALASAAAHTLCVWWLFSTPPRYAYVSIPSEATSAGNHGPGEIRGYASAGSFLGAALGSRTLEIRTAKNFTRKLPEHFRPFFEAVDSYDLEDAAGGLVIFPRRPVLRAYLNLIYLQSQASPNDVLRIASVNGRATSTIPDFLAAAAEVPTNGVLSLRVVRPSPDNDLETLYYSPWQFPHSKGSDANGGDELAQAHLGFSGFLMATPGGSIHHALVRSIGDTVVNGPLALAERFRLFPNERELFFPGDVPTSVPRLRLLPALRASALGTWAVGLPAVYVRLVAGLPSLRFWPSLWSELPKQWYLLDDPFIAPFLFFKLASLFAAVALAASFTGACARRWPVVGRRARAAAFLFAMLLQCADLFLIRQF